MQVEHHLSAGAFVELLDGDAVGVEHLHGGLGDPLADQLVAWMQATGMRPAWALVNQAIEAGVSAIPDAPPALRAFFDHVERLPDWVDEQSLLRGARVCGLGGRAGMRALAVTGLMAGYQLAAVNQTLLATGALEKGAACQVMIDDLA